jgi:acyl carrier protein
MKQNQPIIDKINGLLSDEFEVDVNRMLPGANLRQVLELDSLDYIDLVVVIENNFSFKVKPEDFIRILTFQDFYSYIISRAQPKESTDASMAGQVQGQ